MGQAVKKIALNSEESLKHCLHCGLSMTQWDQQKSRSNQFCCSGCEHVYTLINKLGLKNFYDLKDQEIAPIGQDDLRQDSLNEFDDFYEKNKNRLIVHIEGIQCAACVWLIKKVARSFSLNVKVNTVTSSIYIVNQRLALKEKVRSFLNQIQSLGYNVSFDKVDQDKNRSLLIKLGICSLLAINVMGLNFAIYTGLKPEEVFLYNAIQSLIVVFASLSFFIGGTYFIKKTILAVKNRVFHFDIPIALGILLSFIGSWTTFLFGYGEKSYFDSMSVFIALMLMGRFLQERWLEKNRASILKPKNFKGMSALKIKPNNQLEAVDFDSIEKDMKLVLRSGDIVPVNSEIISEGSYDFDCQWISGESESVCKISGEKVDAGARYIGSSVLYLKSLEDFSNSRLKSLSSIMSQSEYGGALSSLNFSKYYTVFVLCLMFGSFVFNMLYSSFEHAFIALVTISVVTCPCAVGITLPIIQYVLQQKLFNKGVYIQNSNTLSAISKVTSIVFDKTGTLTFLNKQIYPSKGYSSLSQEEKAILFSAVSQSRHPFSQKIFNFMLDEALPIVNLKVNEEVGKGLAFFYEGNNYFLGKNAKSEKQSVAFIKNENNLRCSFEFDEVLLKDSEKTIDNLKRNKNIYLISGDKERAVKAVAEKLKLNHDHVAHNCHPNDKVKWVKSKLKNEKVLYLGDGLNDVEAMQESYLSGSSLSQSFVASTISNFSFKPMSLTWLKDFFAYGQLWKKVVYFNYGLAFVYNVLVSIAATLGFIGPLEAAIIMPSFSIIVLAQSSKLISKT